MTTILQIHTGRTTPESDAEADRRFAAMKTLAKTLVRHIKDNATEDAVLMLTGHLLNVQLQAQQQMVQQIKETIGVRESER